MMIVAIMDAVITTHRIGLSFRISSSSSYHRLLYQHCVKFMELSEAIERSRVDNVYLRRGPRTPQFGSLALTGHHLIFSPQSTAVSTASSSCSHDEELWVGVCLIESQYCSSFSVIASSCGSMFD